MVMPVVANRVAVTAIVVVNPAEYANLREEIQRPEDRGATQGRIHRVDPITDIVGRKDGIAVRDRFNDDAPARGKGIPLRVQQSSNPFASCAHPPVSSAEKV